MKLSLQRARWTAMTMVAVAVNASAVACGVSHDATSHPAPTPSVSGAPAVRRWMHAGGSTDIETLAHDFSTLGGDGQDATLAAGCQHLLVDVHTAQAHDPVPDTTTQRQWAGALDLYSRGAHDCMQGARAQNYAQVAQASTEFDAGTRDIRAVTARLNTLAGR